MLSQYLLFVSIILGSLGIVLGSVILGTNLLDSNRLIYRIVGYSIFTLLFGFIIFGLPYPFIFWGWR